MLYIYNKKEELIDIIKKEDIIRALHKEVLNGENIFSFSVEANNPNLIEGNLVGFKDLDNYWQIFEIKRIVDAHGDGLTRTAYCEHIFYELLDDIVTDKRPSADATSALDGMLQGTRWQVGIVDDLGASNCNAYYEPALSAVQKVANAWQGELRWRIIISNNQITERRVDLLAMRGTDTGKQFAYSKDILSIEREIDTSNIATALYGRGKGVETESGSYGRRLTFADIVAPDKPKGQEWVGDSEALVRWGRNGRHRFDVFIDEDETDPVKLLEKTRAELARRKEPRTTYRLNVVSLEELAGYEHEKVRLGDLVRVIDREFIPELVVSARIVELERDLLVPENTKVVLGNFSPTIVESTINIQRQINEMSSKPYNTKWLDGVIDVLQNAIENTQSYVFQTAEEGILILDAPDYEQATQAMKLGGGIFAIANQKDGNGGWNWRTFGTGSGFTADEITTGKIRADLVEIGPQTTFAPGYDPSQIEGASDPVRVDKRCKALFHFDGSVNDISGITPTFTRNSVAYTSDGRKVDAGVPRFEQGKFGQGVFIEEGTTNLQPDPDFNNGMSGKSSYAWGGSGTVTVSNGICTMDNSSSTQSLALIITIPTTANTGPHTVSIKCRSTNAVDIPVSVYMGVSYKLIGTAPASGEWVILSALYNNGEYITNSPQYTRIEGGQKLQIDWIQVEKKAYATSFTDGTRQPERLHIPIKGIINSQEGTISVRATFSPLEHSPTGWRHLWDTTGLRFAVVWNPSRQIEVRRNGVIVLSFDKPVDFDETKWHTYTIRWSLTETSLFIDGVLWKTVSGTFPELTPGDFLTLGTRFELAGYEASGLFDELAIFDYAATDEEIASWYEADAPFYRLDLPDPSLPGYVKVESEGMKVYDSQDQLRVLLGSWLDSAVRKYGLKIIGGEIYSSLIRTGAEGATRYIALEPPNQLAVYAQKSASEAVPYEVMRFLTPLYANAGASGFEWSYEDATFGKELYAWINAAPDSKEMTIYSKYGQLLLAAGDGVYCAGDFRVVGGTKYNIEHTENYGARGLVARESPEQRYIDEGFGVLKNGICRIDIDPIFLECIEPHKENSKWHIHLTPYTDVDIYVAEIGDDYFIVKEKKNGTNTGAEFTWSLSATRKNYAGIRLMEVV